MLLLRLELWAEGSRILSGTQFGFRKGRETTDCLAVLTTEVKTAFHLKNQGLAAFLDITGAYDNVLIDILCRELKKRGVPVPLVFLLWDMMCEKHLYFFDGQDVAFMCTGFKGLPQESVLSPFMSPTFTRTWLRLVCTLCARFCNMQIIWSCISREGMLRLLGIACRRL
jgi:hypothetical protein